MEALLQLLFIIVVVVVTAVARRKKQPPRPAPPQPVRPAQPGQDSDDEEPAPTQGGSLGDLLRDVARELSDDGGPVDVPGEAYGREENNAPEDRRTDDTRRESVVAEAAPSADSKPRGREGPPSRPIALPLAAVTKQRSYVAGLVRTDRKRIREGFIFAEVLGKPKALQDWQSQ